MAMLDSAGNEDPGIDSAIERRIGHQGGCDESRHLSCLGDFYRDGQSFPAALPNNHRRTTKV